MDRGGESTVDAASGEAPVRLAIVGCGPKGLYALESLCTLAARERHPPRFDITIYEATSHPGAGAIYDPLQPPYLLMNFASRFIDAWDRTISPPSARRPSLVDWLREQAPEDADPGGFVSRAAVGRYLGACMATVLAERPDTIRIRCCFERVVAIDRRGERWRLCSPSHVEDYDEVLITTGHQDWQRRGRLSDPIAGPVSIPSIFPTPQRLSEKAVPPGSVVGFRGFALTWIDAALALTVGRGGVFRDERVASRYVPSGREPARLVPISRTGRPMLAKPDYRRFTSPAPEGLWEERSAAILAHAGQHGSIPFERTIWLDILKGADQAIGAADGTAGAWFESWRSCPFDGDRAWRAMRSSFEVATGRTAPDIAWALGEAWRRTYPALVASVSHGGLHETSWPAFVAIAAEMERIASGPPSVNMGSMLALIEAGLVDLGHVGRFSVNPADPWPPGIDIRVDATIPAPRLFDPGGPIGGLLQAGHLTRGPGGGLVVDDSGQALAGGVAIPGLSVLGRPTEGCVLGNDTLNRALHRHPGRWASRLLRRAAADIRPAGGDQAATHRPGRCLAEPA